jgi:hypothetical protein
MKELVRISLVAYEDGMVSSKIECGPEASLKEVERGTQLCRDELIDQLKNSNKCPFKK